MSAFAPRSGIADIKRARIRGAPIYDYTPSCGVHAIAQHRFSMAIS
jgi:hypothetical protein